MFRFKVTALTLAIATGLVLAGAPVRQAEAAKGVCSVKAAEGTGPTAETAKFQVYEALLQATDWGAWAAWMSSGTTPGYKVNTVKYSCANGSGLGVTCRGQATICKI